MSIDPTLVRPDKSQPKLDSRLAVAARTQLEQGTAAALSAAAQAHVNVVSNKVRVVVEGNHGSDRSGARAAIVAVGGVVEAENANLVQALVPSSALSALAAQADVRFVRPPLMSYPLAIADEGVTTTNANVWQADPIDGTGVRVGIVDLGFAGYTARQATGDLAATLVTQDFCDGGFSTVTDHGAAVAEIVHKMAPGAQLYLLCVSTEVELGQAEAYAKDNNIQIINHSVGWFNTSRGDGTGAPGTPDAIVADARANGILWVNSSGNSAQQHWSGTFSDTDGNPNNLHNFAPADDFNGVTVASGGSVCATLKWDSWPTANQDFDLWLVHFPATGPGTIVAASQNRQTGTLPPTEGLCFTNTGPTDNFYVAIRNFNATLAPRFDLFVFGDVSPIQFQTAAGSIVEPASSPSALAVGAICWQNSALEPYSSQGPTIDGRVKPDLAGPDSTSSATFGAFAGCGTSAFSGTSASSPHVAGAAALALQANPSFGPAQIQTFLQEHAIDLGPTGADNLFGAGSLFLGTPPPHPATPANVSISGTNGFANSATTLTLQWSAVGTAASYDYALGSMPGGTDIRPFTNVGNVTSFTASGLQLTDGHTYFAAVRAVDADGLLSRPAVSTGSTIDTTLPVVSMLAPTVAPGGGVNQASVTLSATASTTERAGEGGNTDQR